MYIGRVFDPKERMKKERIHLRSSRTDFTFPSQPSSALKHSDVVENCEVADSVHARIWPQEDGWHGRTVHDHPLLPWRPSLQTWACPYVSLCSSMLNSTPRDFSNLYKVLPYSPSLSLRDTRTYTHTHAHTHAHKTQTHTNTNTNTHALFFWRTCTQTHNLSLSHMPIHLFYMPIHLHMPSQYVYIIFQYIQICQYRVVPGHRNHLNDPASEFLSTHWWSQNPACQRCFYKQLKNCHPASEFLHSP